jgi:hypothetical protein
MSAGETTMTQNQKEKRKDDALTVLRTETALSRFPLHRLTNSQDVQIELKNQNGAVYWAIHHTTKFGQPGQLAYKIDTLIVNRRIEESGRPAPKIIRLGSLAEIAHDLGSASHNTNAIKQALLQNATASISAKITYRTQEGGERSLEATFNRYSVIFTGEKLPQGQSADAVYLILNDVYQEILQTAIFRPLDYEYMKMLPPISQRFYEIVSYQVYAALKHRNPRAKLLYSDYCAYSTAKRYFDFDHVKKQMYKVLRPHVQSGYISKVEYEAITNENGEADWWMYYTPGMNADREYKAFTGQGKTRKPKSQAALNETLTLSFPEPGPPALDAVNDESTASTGLDDKIQELVNSLVAAELNRSDAERFAREKPESCRQQLAYLPFVEKFKTSRGAYLRRAIEGDFGPPAGYVQAHQRQEQEQTKKRNRAQELFESQEKKARQGHEERFRGAFSLFLWDWVGKLEKTHPEAFTAFEQREEERRKVLTTGPLADRPLTRHALETFDEANVRADRILDFCQSEGQKFRLNPPTFWEWDETINPEPFTI